jgi:hypothetical protein
MHRPFLLALAVGALALGGLAIRQHLVGYHETAAATQLPLESTGMLTLDEQAVHFTLYWPEEDDGPVGALVIFAADAHAAHPRPLRDWARAAAASGVAAAYLEPSGAPEEAAERLRAVLEHHAELLGLDRGAVWTWVEGTGLKHQPAPPPSAPCGRVGTLADVVARAEREIAGAGVLVRRAIDFTFNTRCQLAGMP